MSSDIAVWHDLDAALDMEGIQDMATKQYKPVALDIEATRKRWRRDPAFAAAYDALADEFAALVEPAREPLSLRERGWGEGTTSAK